MTLLTMENAKTPKGEKKGYITGILYLAPNTQSGVTNVCPMAKIAQCDHACLYTAGRGKFTKIKEARIRKTVYFHERKDEFINELARDIYRLENKAKKTQNIPLIRLNGTSDILWEKIKFTLEEETAKKIGATPGEYENIMALFPHIQFYDYTKIASRNQLPTNYDLTFSYSGVEKYQKEVAKAIEKKMRIAVVFRTKDMIPDTFKGMKVVDGDDTDLRHLDPQGVIVSLYAKGDAKKDDTGFVVDIAI